MALSGSVDLAVTRDDLIQAALQYIGAIGDGETPNATQLTETAFLINILIKHWQADDIQLWVRKYAYILPTTGVTKTSLGAEGGHASNAYSYTTTSVASLSGTNTITVTDVTGIADTYNIGVLLSDSTMQWTTVNGAPAGSVVTLTDNLDADVNAGAPVFTYINKVVRPVTVLEAWRRLASDDSDTPMVRLSEQEYNDLPTKTEASTPVQWFYDDTLGFSTSGYPGNGDFYYWPTFADGNFVLVYRYTKPFDDLDAAADNVEFPQMWFLPIMLGLAWLSAGKYGLTIKERQMLFQEMNLTKLAAMGFDQEKGSLFIQPGRRHN